MNIAVCLKLVSSTTANIRVAADGKSLLLDGLETIVSPYDEYAMEAALQLREKFPGSKITALSVGGDDALKVLQHAFSVGADDGIHVKEAGLDARAAARAAAAALKPLGCGVIFCGRQAIDDDAWIFPGVLAELLDVPHLTAAAALEPAADGKTFKCRRRFEGGEQVVELQLPAVVSCEKGLNEPRAPTLKGRLEGRKKQPQVKSAADLGLSLADLAPALKTIGFSPPPQKTPGRVIQAAPQQAAAELVRLLREEAKII